MSQKYIDLVLCKHDGHEKFFLFCAPAFSGLKKGDRVIVETIKGESEATVERSYTISKERDDEFEFILVASGAYLPLRKVLKKIEYIEFEYEEESNE